MVSEALITGRNGENLCDTLILMFNLKKRNECLCWETEDNDFFQPIFQPEIIANGNSKLILKNQQLWTT